MTRLKKAEGYLMVDHRASPGIPTELAIKLGLDPKLVGEGKLMEAATLTCGHCRSVVIVNPLRTRERAHCFKCNSYICDGCKAVGKCRPFTQVVDDVMDGKTPIPVLARDLKE